MVALVGEQLFVVLSRVRTIGVVVLAVALGLCDMAARSVAPNDAPTVTRYDGPGSPATGGRTGTRRD